MDVDGNFIHFPRGTYKEQRKTVFGKIELNKMEELLLLDRVFKRRRKKWKNSSLNEQKKDFDVLKSLGLEMREIVSQ